MTQRQACAAAPCIADFRAAASRIAGSPEGSDASNSSHDQRAPIYLSDCVQHAPIRTLGCAQRDDFGFDCDVAVVGAGLLGCFTARALARFDLKVVVIEQREDVCTGISKANTAIVYSGAYAKPGTLKAELCVRANQHFDELCDELGVRFKRCGSLMVCFGPRGLKTLEGFLEQGRANGLEGLRIIDGEEARRMEPGIASDVYAALHDPHVGTVVPWELGLAAAHDAADNGVHFLFGTQLGAIERAIPTASTASRTPAALTGYRLSLTPNTAISPATRQVIGAIEAPTTLHAKVVINCAGLRADEVSDMVCDPTVRIVPQKGTYRILDTKAAGTVGHVIFHEPEERGKGLTLVPTVGGNILVGPTAEDSLGKDDFATTAQGLAWLDERVAQVFPALPLEHTIRSFAATRPNPYWAHRDEATGETVIEQRSISNFIVSKPPEAPGFMSLIGVKTPGLTCSAELGALAAQEAVSYLEAVYGEVAEKPVAGCGQERECECEQEREQEREQGLEQKSCREYEQTGERTREHGRACEQGQAQERGQARGFERGCKQEREQEQEGAMLAYDPRCSKLPRIEELDDETRERLVARDAAYGRVVCRCRGITEGEIRAAIHRVPRAVTLDGVKRRTEAGMGRCQGSFCTQRVLEILSEETGIPIDMLDKDAPGSRVIMEAGHAPTGRITPNLLLSHDPIQSSLRQANGVDVAIIGGGAAGIAAAIGAAQAGAENVLIIERDPLLGGILNQCIHDGFGSAVFGEDMAGTAFAERLLARLADHSPAIHVAVDTTALRMEAAEHDTQGGGSRQGDSPSSAATQRDGALSPDDSLRPDGLQFSDTLPSANDSQSSDKRPSVNNPSSVIAHSTTQQDVQASSTASHAAILTLSSPTLGVRTIRARSVILATGCRERPIGTLPVAGARPAGVFTAGAVQKMLNLGGYCVGQRAVVLGSGDVGLIVARRLKLTGCDVAAVIEQGIACGGLAFNKRRCLDEQDIPLVLTSTVVEVMGRQRVSAVRIRNLETGAESTIECDTLITSIGLVPERELLEEYLERASLSRSVEASTTPSAARGTKTPDECTSRRYAPSAACGTETSSATDTSCDDANPSATGGAKLEQVSHSQHSRVPSTTSAIVPPWLFVCGNADYVYSIVDTLVEDALEMGERARKTVDNGFQPERAKLC